MKTLRLFVASLILVGCGGQGSPFDEASPEVTWHRDVQPLVMEHCGRCHDGMGVGPGDFTQYDVSAALSELMVARIDAGDMPPPTADPECADYLGSERMTLTETEKEVFRAWIEAGSPEGSPSDASDDLFQAPTLDNPDLETYAAAAYVPQYLDNNNEYRCFLLDFSPSEDVYLTAIEPLIDQIAISHHSVLFMDPSGTAHTQVTDASTQSWNCPDVIPDISWLPTYAWAPGNNLIEMPEGFGMRARAGSQFVLQMHYFAASEDAYGTADLPGYAFETADEVDDEIVLLPLGPSGFTIPAGEADYTVSESYALGQILGTGLKFYGSFPHMHVLGSRYSFRVEGGLADRCVSQSDRYDFDNQPTYWFKEPVSMASDQEIVIECSYDNTAENPQQMNSPPIDVFYGERTDQEMCFALLYARLGL